MTIIGDCPYEDCDYTEIRSIPESLRLPIFRKEECRGCGKVVWVKYSRIDPTAWTEAEFLQDHIVDEEKKEIREFRREDVFRSCTYVHLDGESWGRIWSVHLDGGWTVGPAWSRVLNLRYEDWASVGWQ